jgi:hypothetical protein
MIAECRLSMADWGSVFLSEAKNLFSSSHASEPKKQLRDSSLR